MSRPKKNEELSPIAQFIWDSRAGIDQANREARQISKSMRDMEKSVTQPILDASESMGISLPEAPAQLVSLIREGRQIAEAINGGGLPEKRRTKRNVRDIERQIEPMDLQAELSSLTEFELQNTQSANRSRSRETGPCVEGFRDTVGTVHSWPKGDVGPFITTLWEAPEQAVEDDHLVGPVFTHDRHADRAAIYGLRKRANEFFRDHGLPWNVKATRSLRDATRMMCRLLEGPPRTKPPSQKTTKRK